MLKSLFSSFAVLCVSVHSQVVINEIHYHPVELPAFDANGNPVFQGTATPADFTDDVHEFIELRNAGGASVDVSGWKISGGVDFTFPAGTTIAAGGYKAIAKNPARISAVYAASGVLGPWSGTLKNGGETVRLENGAGATVDSVNYGREFPWPNSPDALAAGDDFTLLNSAAYQYKGRSLQRVSDAAASNDPANWLASPLSPGPTPGAPNAVTRTVPKPVAIASSAAQLSDESATIRAAQQVRIGITMSSLASLTDMQVEYFVDAIDGATAYSEPRSTVGMTALGNNQFSATLPGQADRSVVRWRVKADRGDGVEQVFPRTDDAAIVPVAPTLREVWASYFVQPVRTTTKTAIYDVFVSNSSATNASFNGLNGVTTMNYNITGSPKRVTNAANTGLPRAEPHVPPTAQLWNGSVPCIFVVNGVVRDAHIRYHGSRYNRNAGRNSFKLRFADTQLIGGADSFFITDKSDYFSVCQGLYINANLPMSEVAWVDWYFNNNGVLTRLQQGEYNGDLLDKYHDRVASLNPGLPKEEPGEFYKSTGTIEDAGEGPYGHGSERRLLAAGPWSALQRYEWTYALQSHAWKGAKPVKDFIDGMWTARGDTHTAPNPNIPNLRAYFDTQLDVDTLLSSLAIASWMCPWDDTTQNHFLWRRANGRWNHVLWDFDAMFGNGDTTGTNSWIYLGENGTPPGGILGNNFRGPNWFKDSVFKAYRTEYNNRLWVLNNTYLHPDNLKTLFYRNNGGTLNSYYNFINGVKAGFCEARFASVNTQTGHAADGSDFLRPVKPAATSPSGAVTTLPPASLVASGYAHTSGNTAGANAHAKSKWEIRRSTGDYFTPVVAVTSTTSLTSFAIPFSELTFGEQYFWRVTYLDAADHPSLASDEVSFSFGPPPTATTLISFAQSWKYNLAIQPADATWAATTFDDTAWPAGPGTLAFEVAGQIPETIRTALPDPRTLAPAGRAYYFRAHFNCPVPPASLANLRIRHMVDDGCVIYVNGTRIARHLMLDAASYTHAQLSSGNTTDGTYQFADAPTLPPANAWSYTDPRAFMVQGDNVIAVEVHQGTTGSSDIVMGLEMTATIPATGGDVVINEVAANPAAGADWVELRNVTAGARDISGWGLTDDILNPSRYTFPAGTSVPAGGYLLVAFDKTLTASPYTTGFGLDSGGQRIVLTSGNTIKDFVSFGPQARGYTIGRIADGTGAFTLTNPTPGATNIAVTPLGTTAGLRINEWMAAPAHGEDWFEIHNTDALPVPLSGLWLSDTPGEPQVTQVPPLSYIAAGGYADFVADGTTDGGNRVNFKLSAGGDYLVLSSGYTTLDSLSITSGGPNTSRGRLPDGGATLASFPLTESRGASNWLPSPIVINEALTNSVPPLTDELELHNPTAAAVDITGWWLSDDSVARNKYTFPPGSIIPAGGYLALTEAQFNSGASPFSLSALGEEAALTARAGGVETGYRSQVRFGPAAENVPFGHVLTGAPPGSWKPEFWPLTSRTPNTANSAPVVTPVVINEIHYHPPDLAAADNVRDEFIELHNPTTTAVALAGWRLKGGSDFTFPAGATLRAGDYILLVTFDPATDAASLAAFRAALGVSASTPVFGPFTPKLANDQADVEIARPDGAPFVNVDKARYADFAPWPPGADGTGPSLQCASRTVIGNDPANWAALAATPGAVNTGQTAITDNDGDGIPNAYEDANGLDKFTDDSTLDLDGDGQGNGAEHTSGHAPNDPASRFTAEALPAAGGAKVRFTAKAGRTYTIQYRNALTSGTWLKLTDIAAPGADTIIEHTDVTAQPARFYRIATPAQP
jgi:Lamin Tail Domain/CotH kinase protein